VSAIGGLDVPKSCGEGCDGLGWVAHGAACGLGWASGGGSISHSSQLGRRASTGISGRDDSGAAGRLGGRCEEFECDAVGVAEAQTRAVRRVFDGAVGYADFVEAAGPGLQLVALGTAVTGFVLSAEDLPTVYISGDNASLEIVRTIAKRCGAIDAAVLFAVAAKTELLGDALLTLSSANAAEAALILGSPRVLAVYTDGWAHFTEDSRDLRDAFVAAGLAHPLHCAAPGETVTAHAVSIERVTPSRG
jgi:hypothetical protein